MATESAGRRKIFVDEDYRVDWNPPFPEVRDELQDLSRRLLELMPDPSIGPQERLERLARVVPNSVLITAHRRSARSKLVDLQRRLDELVPDPQLSYPEKLEWLVERLNELVPGEQRPIEKLETIGDFRGTDIGVSPRWWE